ncbi:mannonate dehydratase [Roseomonas nepalensis]|uniref:Mannonate dehydratase n=1 Tax=Muricoccus nepalensis TaxID=1854500 RepID=A0A502GDA7_9PROT|nr:mannonate dehydratase [Roseomonas nepalensis]TPG59731.1 mannonate dehydratase [Roseomonas nepalensis]
MEETWRWFGPDDAVRLDHIRQAGPRGIVTALHHVPYGEVWTVEEIERRQAVLAADPSLGLHWRVVESLPVHEKIRRGDADCGALFENYRRSMRHLAACGVTTICYNFMPVLDWTRTELRHTLPGGGRALRFNAHEYVGFDVFILGRAGAEEGVAPDLLARARAWVEAASDEDKAVLLASIMAGLPGAYDRYDVAGLRRILAAYGGMTAADLKANLRRFLEEVVPTAEELGMRLAMHPDDPPRPLFGLPRVVSTEEDIADLLAMADSPANGLTLCTGSLGAHPANDPARIAARFADRIHFAHLRNVAKEPDGSFMEADHLGGDTDMVAVVEALLAEEGRRRDAGRADWRIPFRPDHGHELADDIGKPTFPGYPLIGRLRGLAELRGVMAAVARLKGLPL